MKDWSGKASCIVTIVAAISGAAAAAAPPSGEPPERVTFASADGHTTLVGYLFKPENPRSTRAPAVVMMHAAPAPIPRRQTAGTTPRRSQGAIRHGAASGHNRVILPFWSMVSAPAATRMAFRDNDANATATEDVIARAIEFLASVLKP